MFKKFIPFATAKNIYEIDTNFFIKNNIKTILCDLDNTLDPYDEIVPRKEAHDLVKKLKEVGIEFIIFSNNKEKRVKPYADSLGIKYYLKIAKPLKYKAEKIFKKINLNKDETLIIGDQLLTDILFSNKVKIKGVFCDKLGIRDFWWTRLMRGPEKIIKNYLSKHNLLIDYKEL